MAVFILSFVFAFLTYLLLTMGSGDIALWSFEEIVFGVLVSIITAFMVSKVFSVAGIKISFGILNPVKWLLFLIYLIGPFFLSMAKANLDVAYRVITGNINPAIVKISPGLKTDMGITLLANSITLTPGTLSVDIDEESNDLYIHCINVKSKTPDIKDICGDFVSWIRRTVE